MILSMDRTRQSGQQQAIVQGKVGLSGDNVLCDEAGASESRGLDGEEDMDDEVGRMRSHGMPSKGWRGAAEGGRSRGGSVPQ